MSFAVALVVGLITLAIAAWPLFRGPQEPAPASRSAGARARLLARKEALLESLADLDFEYASGKLAAKDYEPARATLIRDTALVLQQLDLGPADALDAFIEAEVAAERAAGTGARPPAETDKPAGVCDSCATPFRPGAKFCKKCGGSLIRPSCASCGRGLDADARFCIECGAPSGGAEAR